MFRGKFLGRMRRKRRRAEIECKRIAAIAGVGEPFLKPMRDTVNPGRGSDVTGLSTVTDAESTSMFDLVPHRRHRAGLR